MTSNSNINLATLNSTATDLKSNFMFNLRSIQSCELSSPIEHLIVSRILYPPSSRSPITLNLSKAFKIDTNIIRDAINILIEEKRCLDRFEI